MTDQPTPSAPSPAAPGPPAPAPAIPAPDATRKSGNKRPIIVVGILVAFLAIVLYATRDNTAADDLKAGDCFDVPTGQTVTTVVHHPCTEAHTAEVFHVVEYSGQEMTTPLTLVIDDFASTACGPVFATYVGKPADAMPDLTINYFYPSVDGWSQGDRTITCYITKTDESSMSASLKGSAGQ
jgi:hypothetical protein